MIGAISPTDVFVFWAVLVGFVLGLSALAWLGWRLTSQKIDVSPYTGLPLRYGRDIGFYAAEQIYRFLFDLRQYDNRMFDLRNAAFCRETGRVFPEAVTWLDAIRVDWSFIQKRLKGQWVSWGSLSADQQRAIQALHGSLEGFQTLSSSSNAIPRRIEPEYAYMKPGPLYVDITTSTLMGWKLVPGTDFEVLIVQKPLKIIYQKTE